MKRKITILTVAILLLIFSSWKSPAQSVSVLNQSNFTSNTKPDIFKCITNPNDTSHGNYVATLQIIMDNKPNALTNAYVDIREYATKMNANAFRLNSYQKVENNQRSLTLDVYYFEDTKNIVRAAYQNKIYIFCDDRDNNDTYDLKVNSKKVSFRSGTYLHYETREKESIKLNKGGITGMQVTLNYGVEKLPVFLSMNSFGMEPGFGGIGFNTGRFSPINANLGYLLIQCLQEAAQE